MPDQYTRMGKQILTEDGEHFADAASLEACEILLDALNAAEPIRSISSAV